MAGNFFVEVGNLLNRSHDTEIILSLDDLCVFPPENKDDVQFLADSMEIAEEWRLSLADEELATAIGVPLGEHIDRFLEIGEKIMAGNSV